MDDSDAVARRRRNRRGEVDALERAGLAGGEYPFVLPFMLASERRETLIGDVDSGVLGKLIDVMALRDDTELTNRIGVAVAAVAAAVATLGRTDFSAGGMRICPPRTAETALEVGMGISVESGMRNRGERRCLGDEWRAQSLWPVARPVALQTNKRWTSVQDRGSKRRGHGRG